MTPSDSIQPQDQGCKALAAHDSGREDTDLRRQQATHKAAPSEGSLHPHPQPALLRPGRPGAGDRGQRGEPR